MGRGRDQGKKRQRDACHLKTLGSQWKKKKMTDAFQLETWEAEKDISENKSQGGRELKRARRPTEKQALLDTAKELAAERRHEREKRKVNQTTNKKHYVDWHSGINPSVSFC